MENKEIALKLVLGAIGEDPSISSVADRLRLQKAVYLTQEMGIPLEYNYSWYVKGPYSPPLTQDYYNLNAAIAAGDEDIQGLALHADIIARAEVVKECLEIPSADVEKPNWYEALCSLHYLMTSSGKNFAEAKGFMADVKPHLDPIVDSALERLQKHGLIPAT